jgi:hypothetical protein
MTAREWHDNGDYTNNNDSYQISPIMLNHNSHMYRERQHMRR